MGNVPGSHRKINFPPTPPPQPPPGPVASKQARAKAAAEKKANEAAAREAGAGNSGVAGEKPSLSRSNSLPNSSSSFGSSPSNISLSSQSSDSPLPSMFGGPKTPGSSQPGTPHDSQPSTPGSSKASTTASDRVRKRLANWMPGQVPVPKRIAKWLGGDLSGSEPSSPGSSVHSAGSSDATPSQSTHGSSRLSRSKSAPAGIWHTATTVPIVDIGPNHNLKNVIGVRHAGFEPAKPEPFTTHNNPLYTPVNIPEIQSGPSSPAKHPTPDQAGRPEFPRTEVLSRTSSMEAALNQPLPETNWDFTKKSPEKKPALSTGAKIGLGVATLGTLGLAGAGIAKGMTGSDDSSNGDGSVQA